MTEKQKTCLGFWKGNHPLRWWDGNDYYNVEKDDAFLAVPKEDYDKLKDERDFYKKSYHEIMVERVNTVGFEECIPKEKVRNVINDVKFSNYGERNLQFVGGWRSACSELKKQLLSDEMSSADSIGDN